MSQSEALIPEILNVTVTPANTEVLQALPKGTKYFSLQCRTAFDVRHAFETGKVATPTAPYGTIKSGQVYNSPEKLGWSWSSTADSAANLYLASAEVSVVVEIILWKDKR